MACDSHKKAKKRGGIFFEVFDFRNGDLIQRGTQVFNDFTISYELDTLPTAILQVPARDYNRFRQRNEVKIYHSEFTFCGIVDEVELDKVNEIVTIRLSHILSEWLTKAIPVNLAVKNTTIPDLYNTKDFGMDLWEIDFDTTATAERIEYLFSRQNKLEALGVIIDQTEKLHWRVPRCKCRNLEIGEFGEDSGLRAGLFKSSGEQTLAITNEMIVVEDYTNIVNKAVVLAGSDSNGEGQINLTHYTDGNLTADPGFPVTVDPNVANTEITYRQGQAIEYAQNRNDQIIVTDSVGLAQEGYEYEGTFHFSDIYPISEPDKRFSNADRLASEVAVYKRLKRKLIHSRRKRYIEIAVDHLPCDFNVGMSLDLVFNNQIKDYSPCGEQIIEILNEADKFYVSRIETRVQHNSVNYLLTLDEYLRGIRYVA